MMKENTFFFRKKIQKKGGGKFGNSKQFCIKPHVIKIKVVKNQLISKYLGMFRCLKKLESSIFSMQKLDIKEVFVKRDAP